MRRTSYALRVREPSISQNADQIEISAMRNFKSVVDDAARDDIVSGELDDEIDVISDGAPAGPRWQSIDLAQDEVVGTASDEIQRRADILGEAYPFSISGNTVAYTPSKTHLYEFCLVTSCAPTVVSKPYTALVRAFERSAAELIGLYFGGNSLWLHTGWPRTPKSRFKTAMSSLKNSHYEWVWGPEENLDGDPDYTVIKDETVDFVVTVNKLDARPGNLYVLGQCACGDNWNSKIESEPNLERISKWFKPPWLIPPVKAFTTPFILGDELLRESTRAGKTMVFDRMRLTLIAENLATTDAARLFNERLSAIHTLVATKSEIA